jgi:tetratricopeptide (TPR) repeat protein
VLDPAERSRLEAGEHEALAGELRRAGRHALAGWVREQIWDFEGALADYLAGGHVIDALRVALESGTPRAIDEALAAVEAAGPDEIDAAVAVLRQRRRNMEVARLLARREAPPQDQAQALLAAGNRLGAAQALAAAGRPRDALEALALHDGAHSPTSLALAARLSWDLGDAEGAARHAQAALRLYADAGQERSPALAALLARALGSLGHDLAAQLVLQRHGAQPTDDAVPGRYRVTGLLSTGLSGAAYVGVDRLTLHEVEIHLLLADQPEPIDPHVAAAIDRFLAVAVAAAEVGHPAIRPVLRAEPEAGLLVLPRAEGPPLRRTIRPPGLHDAVPRARSLVAFLVEGLAAAHERGLVHGGVLPSLLVTDALRRPQLGPFGAHHLAGLAATRTGGLEELMITTAPELRRGGTPTARSDLYATGVLLHALLVGRLEPPRDDAAIAPAERALIEAMTADDPELRPTATEVLARLRAPVADVRQLGRGAETTVSRTTAEGAAQALLVGVEVSAAESWTPALLDALCTAANPWMQPILDREGPRVLVLAPWPEHTRGLDDGVAGWRGLVPEAALELPEPLRAAIEARLRPRSVVVTADGERMLALDDLLSR